jgi:hypothetical protein
MENGAVARGGPGTRLTDPAATLLDVEGAEQMTSPESHAAMRYILSALTRADASQFKMKRARSVPVPGAKVARRPGHRRRSGLRFGPEARR